MPGEIFFTADHHFFHDGIIRMCGRPFSSVDEMNEVMVERWNAVVRPGDTVHHLGDFALKGTSEGIAEIFGRLRGRKYLVVGNHDKPRVRDLPWASPPQQRVFLRHPDEKVPLVLDHYSMRTWPSAHHGAIHLYGHSHGALPGVGRSLDVGVDCWDFRPVTLDELRPTLERQAEEFERQQEAARLFRERAARGDPATALSILRRVPDVAPEPGDELRRATRVVSDPSIMGGAPCVEGTRVPAATILAEIRAGMLDIEIRESYPTLPEDGIHAVREWAAGRMP